MKTPNLASAIELFGQICLKQDNILAFEFMEKNAIDLVMRHFQDGFHFINKIQIMLLVLLSFRLRIKKTI